MMINVLIVGSGGREHAFTWKASQSDIVEKVFVAPGNAGTTLEPKAKNIAINASDIDALVSFSIKENIDLVIVGPSDLKVPARGTFDVSEKFIPEYLEQNI